MYIVNPTAARTMSNINNKKHSILVFMSVNKVVGQVKSNAINDQDK